MEDKIREIVSGFLNIPAEEIRKETPIDRSALKGSIILHRMYAVLAKEGVPVSNYTEIRNFGHLLQKINGVGEPGLADVQNEGAPQRVEEGLLQIETPCKIGIDIEEISALPVVNDLREDEFYKMNFSPAELAYCILKPDPYASLTGLFAAKEAIVKADERYRNSAFSKIEISHLPDGKPVHSQFQISISHTPTYAIAVAVQVLGNSGNLAFTDPASVSVSQSKTTSAHWLAILALVIASLALFLVLNHHSS